MTQTEKYVWLIDTILKANRISLKEISDRWRDYAGLDDDEELHRSRFNRWKDDILIQFGIIIACRRKGGYKYYIENPEVIEENRLLGWMLDTLATGNVLHDNIDLNNRILVNKIPSGNRHLKDVITAMKINHKLEITHRRFGYASASTFVIDPYCIKLFENRWYVLGKNNFGSVRIYGLDRIEDLRLTNEKFSLPVDFDAESFFAPYFGVTVGQGKESQIIVLRAYKEHKYYMSSLPIHESQELIEDAGEYADFRLYLAPTSDLIMKLLSFGNMIEVLKPETLRQEMMGYISDMNQMYNR